MTFYIQPAPVLHIWWCFHPSGLTHFCMFVIHQHDLVLQGYCFSVNQAQPTFACLWYIGLTWLYKATRIYYFPPDRPDPLLHVYDTSAWSGFTRLHYVPLDPAWPTFACLWYIGLIWVYKAPVLSPSSGLTHFCMFTFHRPGLLVQGYIIDSLTRPDLLLQYLRNVGLF